MHKESRSRMVILGLDGLPLSLARKLSATGNFPHLAKLTKHAQEIRAELPELSPVNWTSFATGVGPETHGIFGFTRIHAHTYEISLCDSTQIQCQTIFQKLSAQGLHSRIINLPNTYPAQPLHGMLVAGFVAPELTKAVYPPFLQGPLGGIDYQLEADTTRGLRDPAYLLEELHNALASRRRALSLFWQDLAWDCFVFVLTETDRLFHFLYDAVEEATHPWHSDCMTLLKEWDDVIGEVLEKYDALSGPKRLMALADHGFTRLQTEVDLNAYLRAQGLLHTALPPGACDELQATTILPATKAFALDPSRIYIHSAARFAKGTVSTTETHKLRNALCQALQTLSYKGSRVFAAVHAADDIYSGPMRPFAPDIICEPNPGFDCKAKFNRREIFGFWGRTGTHTVTDAFFYDSQGSSPTRLRDTGQEISNYFNIR